MSKFGRGAVALLVVLVLAALWRTGVRAGERDARARGGRDTAAGGVGESAEAARHLEMRLGETRRRLAAHPRDSRLLLRLANLYYQRAYSRALDAYSADPAAARRLEEGDDRQYRDWMGKALAHDPSGDLHKSARAAREGLATERDPKRRWELLRSLARTECTRGAHDRELQALEEGRRHRPGDQEVLSRLARAYGEVGRPLAVEEVMEQAWRRTRRPGLSAPVASDLTSPAAHSADRPWASSAHDGDEWLAGLPLRSP